jgi:hypothetical protein
MRTLEQFEQLARGVTRGHTAEQISAIATICYNAQVWGEVIPVWHAAAMVSGYLERCQCAPCCQKRKESAD